MPNPDGSPTPDELDAAQGAPMPMPTAPAAPPVALPPQVNTSVGSSTTQRIAGPAERQAFEQQQALVPEEKKVAADQNKLAQDEARVQADAADERDRQIAANNAEIQAAELAAAEERKARNDKFLTELDALKKTAPPQGFDGWTGNKKALSYLSVALGGLASGNTGGVNLGLQQVQKQVNDEFERHKFDLEQRWKGLAETRGLNADMVAAAKDDIARLYGKKAMALDSLNAHAQAQVAALGIPKSEQAGILQQLGLDRAAAAARQAFEASVSVHKTGKYEQTTETGKVHFAPGGAAANATPKVITDQLSGQTLPIDPSRTDTRKHNAAVAVLPPINTFLDTSSKMLAKAQKTGAATPELIAGLFGGNATQAERNADITRLRSAYAAAKHESVGAENWKHLEEAIPSPPSSVATRGQWNAWLTKIRAVNEEMTQLRREQLSNAGVPPEVIDKVAVPREAEVDAAAPASAGGEPEVRVGADGTTYVKVGGKITKIPPRKAAVSP